MGAYNRFRGEQACESRWLLTEVLREQWGFEGFTISDFLYGIHDGVKAIEAGMDVEMPMPVEYQQKLLAAVEGGHVAESVVDLAVLRVLRTLLVFENTPDPQEYGAAIVACREHCDLAREVAEKSMVLIKNEGPVLPFDRKVKRVLVLGSLAAQANTGDRGSSRVNPPYVITPLEGIRRFLGEGVEVLHRDERQVAEAQNLAQEVDCVVIVGGCNYNDEGEYLSPDAGAIAPLADGFRNMGRPLVAAMLRGAARLASGRPRQGGLALGGDRQSLGLKAEQAALIQAVGGINPNTVVCLVGGSMILIEEWAERVPALLYTWYAGMEGGTALACVLFGEVNPSGRLPFSIVRRAEDLPYFSSTDREITYDRYHGYAHLDRCGVKPVYPFGFGLSYTSFAYNDLRVEREVDALWAHVCVANTGRRAGEEVVQVYVGVEGSAVDRPRKLLKGFQKVAIGAGESQEVSVRVALDDLRFYDEEAQTWRLESCTYVVMVGPWADEASLLEERVELS
jgi:beta-glucosidase